VCRADAVLASDCTCYFSNIALNSLDSEIVFGNTLGELKDGVIWSLFDDPPMTSHIPEIGYGGVCQYFHNRDTPAAQQNRSRHRMAEFLVRERLPLNLVQCIVVQNENIADHVRGVLAANDWEIPVLVKQGCFFS
jgi:ssDNA thymidine ADP-ribosyltransferase, DarT